ncbi:MAG TPA: Glu/Leu/Phe/Val dehydrogenase dimerization domain-containing protein [Gemmatimonadales bacterium]|nr:Glu/Leu/Phe/Val dehydrogenase dimerization domain-containing protein [Gemmatimonadales bacterium]
MRITELHPAADHELVLMGEDERAGYRAILAIHSSRLGPAVGGTRLWRYASPDEALTDALRLSRGMSYKNAVAALPMGGGKSVILADGPIASRERLFAAHGRFVESLGGRYITAEDVGTSHLDMTIVKRETRHVAGLRDPSPVTAHGVFRALLAAARHRWGDEDLTGRTVALQGCGNVGSALARALAAAGARLVVSDVDSRAARRCAVETGATNVAADSIYDVAADVFAPCALGGILNDRTIPRLRCEIVVGAANNQLAVPADADRLAARGVLYVPDYVANAGGVIDGARDICGWSDTRVGAAVEAIYDTTRDILRRAEAAGITPAAAADQQAEAALREGSARA